MIHESIGARRWRGFTAAIALAAGAWLVTLPGCQGRRAEQAGGGGVGGAAGGGVVQRDATAAQTVYVPADGRVVIAEFALGLTGTSNVEVLADGRRVRGVDRRWIAIEAPAQRAPAGEIHWINAATWRVAPTNARNPSGEIGVWALAFEVPAGARELTIGGRRAIIAREVVPLPEVHVEALEVRDADLARAMLAPLERDPTQRWRLELTYARSGLGQPPPLPPLADPLLAGWAQQESQRVWAALRNLHEADAALARQVIDAMTLCVRVPEDLGGGIVSAWPLDPRADERLFAALLRPDVTSRTRAAEAWLEQVPIATAVATDVGGLRSGTSGAPIATVRVANLTGAPRLVSTSIDDAGAGDPPVPDPVTVGARSMDAIYIEGVARPISLRAESAIPTAKLRSGDWGTAIMMPFTVKARPPGVTIGPLLPDLTHATWLDPENNWFVDVIKSQSEISTFGQLFLKREDGRQQWMLHLECAMPPSTSTAGDALRVWLGPIRQPVAVIQLPRVGQAKVEVGGRDASDAATAAHVVTLDDRWIAQLPMPPSAIERDGTLRIGVERLDARGVRTAWPCRMFPWQVEPGRFSISTSDWLALPPSPLDEP